MKCCVKCGKETENILTTVFGEDRCEFCYDDYLMTDKGKVEYFVGIVTGDLLMEDYDADFLIHVAACWKKYRDELFLSIKTIRLVELEAVELGLLQKGGSMAHCIKCNEHICKTRHTLDGEALCEDCWTGFLNTYVGQVEYNQIIYRGAIDELVESLF